MPSGPEAGERALGAEAARSRHATAAGGLRAREEVQGHLECGWKSFDILRVSDILIVY